MVATRWLAHLLVIGLVLVGSVGLAGASLPRVAAETAMFDDSRR